MKCQFAKYTMGPVLSQLKDDGAEKEKDQLNMMEENMKNKLMDFKKAIQLQRGDNVSATEIGGGRTVQRSTTMRVVHKTGTSEGIKSAVGDFFDAAQGGKKAKASALKGAQKLIGSSIDGLLGTGSGSSNECSEFVVVFMNYSFVRIDYMAYYYNVEGKGILKSGQQGGFCSIMDVSIIPHEQIRNEEITYLLSQALHMEPGESSFEKDLKVLMTLEVLLAEERLLTRKMNDETTTLEDIRRMKDQLNNNKVRVYFTFIDEEYSFLFLVLTISPPGRVTSSMTGRPNFGI